jgi:HSP20 family protein
MPEVDEFFRSFSDLFNAANTSLPVEMYEENGEVVVSLDVPGIDPDKIEVRAFPDRLLVRSSQETAEECPEGRTYHCRKRATKVNYSIAVPAEVDPEKVRASVKNGVMTIRLARKERDEGRVVEIKNE